MWTYSEEPTLLTNPNPKEMFRLNKKKSTQQFALVFLSYDNLIWNYTEPTNFGWISISSSVKDYIKYYLLNNC